MYAMVKASRTLTQKKGVVREEAECVHDAAEIRLRADRDVPRRGGRTSLSFSSWAGKECREARLTVMESAVQLQGRRRRRSKAERDRLRDIWPTPRKRRFLFAVPNFLVW
jgi:hypothetical protein